ncbi:MAG TPA: biotin/lipoate A/B protein ligase family protein [Acidimicrobiia bacterium]|nr:biotin/lipoate A/B protein ligase family protein [Acidimicrobiia bacterium]
MTRSTWRLLDDLGRRSDADGQMAADVALLDEVAAGAPPALRLYRWAPPALSLGRFQPDAHVKTGVCARLGVEVTRRPTGGKALLHGADLTYAVALPRPAGRAGTVDGVYTRLAASLLAGLARLGVAAAVARHGAGPAAGPACATAMQGADLRVGERKLCGSAQARARGAVLQHGSILLDRLDFDESDLLVVDRATCDSVRGATITMRELGAPHDPEVVGAAVVQGFAETLDVDFT